MDPIAIGTVAVILAAAGVAWAAGRHRAGSKARTEVPQPDLAADRPPVRGLRQALEATRRRLREQLEAARKRTAGGGTTFDALEEALIGADVGVRTSATLLDRCRARLQGDHTPERVRAVLRDEISNLVAAGGPVTPRTRPWVVLVTGVNGVGKTTTIGKLAAVHRRAGRTVLIVAADTFRAAAIDQLTVWAERSGAEIVRHGPGADPSAVVYDGMRAAISRGVDVVLIDTAGRLHTRSPLMDELRKVRRTIEREIPGGPQEALLVLDATTGQNALNQARAFLDAAGVTGVVVTKLDGTARGGIVLAIAAELGLPVRYVGVGEGVADLREFEGVEFVTGLLGEAGEA